MSYSVQKCLFMNVHRCLKKHWVYLVKSLFGDVCLACVFVCVSFWLAVQELKKRPIREVPSRVQEIWDEFLASGAPSAINLDSKSYDKTMQNVKDPGRYTFEDAQVTLSMVLYFFFFNFFFYHVWFF